MPSNEMITEKKEVQEHIPPHELMKMYRVRLGYSQERLADLINEISGGEEVIYQMRISRFESGKLVPDARQKQAINKILKTKVW